MSVRIIPVLLLYNGRMVKTKQFKNIRDVGNPAGSVRVYNAQGADELIFLNIGDNSREGSEYLKIIKSAAEEAFMPLTAGGGVRTMDDIQKLLESGADKVVLNTATIETPNLVNSASKAYGKNCIVVSIDVKIFDGTYEVVTANGNQRTGISPVDHAKKMESLGAGEILLTSVDRDGTMIGYDLDLFERVANSVYINVIPNGGVGALNHFTEAITRSGASSLASSSIYHFTDQHVLKVKAYLENAGFDVRT